MRETHSTICAQGMHRSERFLAHLDFMTDKGCSRALRRRLESSLEFRGGKGTGGEDTSDRGVLMID